MKDSLNMKRLYLPNGACVSLANDGGKIIDTDFFDGPLGKMGAFMLSFNAGEARLLVPDAHRDQLVSELGTARHVVLSMGTYFDGSDFRQMGELMFEDNSEAPFSIHIQTDMIDRKISTNRQETKLRIYIREGQYNKTFKLFIRTVPTLPCLQPW